MNKEVEIWKNIPGYEGLYQVSNLGRVKSLKYRGGKYEKVMVGGINGSGYRHVILRCNGEQKTKKIHQLVVKDTEIQHVVKTLVVIVPDFIMTVAQVTQI